MVKALHVFNYMEILNVNDISFGNCYQRVTIDQNIQSKFQEMNHLYVDAGE